MKNTKLAVLIVLGALLLLSGAISVSAESLRISYNPMPFNLPSMVERDQQLLANQGIKVDYNTFLVGYTMTEALAAQELDVAMVMGATSLITSKAGGRDVQILSVYSQAPEAFALAALPGKLALDQLSGARIAVPVGTEAHYLLGKILQEQDLSLADVEVVNMLIPDGIGALQAKQVDAAMVVEPVLTRLATNGKIEIIRDGAGLIAGLTVSAVRGDFADDRLLTQLQQAHLSSVRFIKDHPEQALRVAEQETGLAAPIVAKIAPKYNFNPTITAEVLASLEDTIKFLYDEGIIRKRISVDDLVR